MVDMDAAIRDDPPTSSSTKSQTRAAEDRRSSNSASTSRRVACSTLSCAVASSRRSASQAQPGGGLSKRSQIRVVGRSSFKRCMSTFWNSATSSFTTFVRVVLPSKRPSTDSMAEDTVA
jgi:hypothetical protein